MNGIIYPVHGLNNMKTKLSALLLAFLLSPFVIQFTVAQTYSNGVWYSLYDTQEHTMNTQGDYETTVFAPTAGKLNVQWRYEWIDWFGVARKIDTQVLESANKGSSTNKIGQLAENTDKNSHTTENFNLSRNINWIKFNREGLPTHKVIVYHLAIPLAQHILFASGDYGTTTVSHDFGEQDALSSSEPYMLKLRSFLSAGDITVSCSEPEIFRLGAADNTEAIIYAVGANACASAKGSAAEATEGVLANIDNYSVPVYFTPQEGKEYAAVITITDGTSTVKATVTGIGRKIDQTIEWNPTSPILSSSTIETASASSGLPVEYTIEPEGIVAYENGAFSILSEGKVTITASQSGNSVYNAAESVTKVITINPAKTHYEYSKEICAGDVYSDEHFENLSAKGLYYDTIPNVYGGDSIICLNLIVNDVYAFEDTRTVYLGVQEVWQEVDLSLLPLCDTTLVAEYATLSGCDSVYTLHLSVIPIPATYGADTLNLCEGGSGEYKDKTYDKPGIDSVLLDVKNHLGGDSVVVLVVNVWSVMHSESEQTIMVGEEQVWQNINLATLPVCDTTLVAEYVSVHGCDSVFTLHLSVIPRPTTYGADTLDICEGGSGEYEGKVYDSPGKDSVLISTKNHLGGDSVVVLVVNQWPVFHESSELSIEKGEKALWQDRDLSSLPVCDTTLVAEYATVHGCDSVYTLHLTVLPLPVTYGSDTIHVCAGEKVEYEGRTYKRPTTDSVLVSQPNRFGGDSIVVLVVYVRPVMRLSANKTITEGEAVVWQNMDLSTIPAGDTTLVAEYTSVYGCDSTFTLHLTVLEKTATGLHSTEVQDEDVRGTKVFIGGHMFIRKGDELYDLTGRKVE